MTSKKVLITGNFGVGKTSLFNRFLHNTFGERYLTTIGVKVDKRELELDGQRITLMLWDIAGEVSQDKVPRAYFLGSSAVIYVFDLTRPQSYANMDSDIEYLNTILPGVFLLKVGNKVDLLKGGQPASGTFENIDFFTSAKTGEQVEELFAHIGRYLLGIL